MTFADVFKAAIYTVLALLVVALLLSIMGYIFPRISLQFKEEIALGIFAYFMLFFKVPRKYSRRIRRFLSSLLNSIDKM